MNLDSHDLRCVGNLFFRNSSVNIRRCLVVLAAKSTVEVKGWDHIAVWLLHLLLRILRLLLWRVPEPSWKITMFILLLKIFLPVNSIAHIRLFSLLTSLSAYEIHVGFEFVLD